MRRKEKQKAKVEYEEDTDNEKGTSSSFIFRSSDDEEANEDLSLKIVEKALRMKEANRVPNDGVLDSAGGSDVGLDSGEIKMKRKKKKVKKVESGDHTVTVAEEQERVETIKPNETNESTEASTVQMGDNMVLRKLLRGPRYFDPPDNSWGACFNCGEAGHNAVNCKAVKRKKPCFVCGSLEHAAKQCIKGRDCFICKKSGHRAKDCPEKNAGGSKNSAVCLKCGNSGHDMFSCTNNYSLDDLKEIQCYVCKELGHLCCVTSDDATKWELSCYKCGQLGHSGLACLKLRGEFTDATTPNSCFKCGKEGHFARECTNLAKACLKLCGEFTDAVTPNSCFKCGKEGHFARECTNLVKAQKRNRELSNTKSPRSYKEKDYLGSKSAPPDMGKARKKKKAPTEDVGLTTPKKSKRRGGWIPEDPEEYSSPKFKDRGASTFKKSKRRGDWMNEDPGELSTPKFKGKSKHRGNWVTEDPGEFYSPKFKNRWMSPATPSSRNADIIYQDFMQKGHAGSSRSHGSARSFQHRFSASRFGNSNSNPPRYDWW